MEYKDQVLNATEFVKKWSGKGSEKEDCQKFWLELLSSVYGVEDIFDFIEFEQKVLGNTVNYIDAFINRTKVLIEQKSIGVNLKKAYKQSDGSMLTPFQQAKKYVNDLEYSRKPKWIIICNFEEFLIYNMDIARPDPISLKLSDLASKYQLLNILTEVTGKDIEKEKEISIKAGELVGVLYNELLKEYKDPDNSDTLHSLNIFCVRIVFCLYADDVGLFGQKGQFYKYIRGLDGKYARLGFIELFKTLNTKVDERDKYLDDELTNFPYVNGGIFEDLNIEIPRLNQDIIDIILSKPSDGFSWKDISPTIFGSVFESTLNPDIRHSGGMHYTSIEDIHKVIDPLFLNDLNEELLKIKEISNEKKKVTKLEEYQVRLSKIKVMDPSCGSGNFLTETYLSLRKLENTALDLIHNNQVVWDIGVSSINPKDSIKVSISQFYGIEINDFASTVAKIALWIAESQMMEETQRIMKVKMDFFPLKSYANITVGNALEINWEEIVSNKELTYIIGNPPFLGYTLMNDKQKYDRIRCFDENVKCIGKLDYVSGWFIKSAKYIDGTKIEVAFVSTDSITQGEQVPILWRELFKYNMKINFAYKSFKWNNGTIDKALVYCTIIGFGQFDRKVKYIYNSKQKIVVKNINSYIIDGKNALIESRNKSICDVSEMVNGSRPIDDGYLSKWSIDEMTEVINKYPESKELFRKIVGADEFINNKDRYCLWLKDINPNKYTKIKPIMDAVRKVKEFRLRSKNKQTIKKAETPYLFDSIRHPIDNYLLIPSSSSSNRKYIPMGFMSKDIISINSNLIIPNSNIYEFGVLTSNVHMSWVRVVCGRYGVNFRYSANIVYNNFPWCKPNDKQKQKIEMTAQKILDIRKQYSDCSLAELYNEYTMPYELLKAHQDNDRAVMEAYEMDIKTTTEESCLAILIEMYEEYVLAKK
ncbi:MAG: DNA methyltransferase [Peptostreptococcaceae bacterium]